MSSQLWLRHVTRRKNNEQLELGVKYVRVWVNVVLYAFGAAFFWLFSGFRQIDDLSGSALSAAQPAAFELGVLSVT